MTMTELFVLSVWHALSRTFLQMPLILTHAQIFIEIKDWNMIQGETVRSEKWHNTLLTWY